VKEYIATPADAGTRLDVVVASLYPEFTRSSLELLFDKQRVSVNGKKSKAAYKLRPMDSVAVDESLLRNSPEPIELPVIYQDDDVVVIDKPAGVLTHSKGALNLEATVADFIGKKITDESLSGNRAGIVHRLDRATSGVIITAKNQKAMKYLQRQFSQRKVKKTYHAVAEGFLEPKEALIDAPIARNPKKPQTFKVLSSGKPATTGYKVLKDFKKNGKNFSRVELKPLTGRTHQLRVHMAYIGHPIVGDVVYGHGGNNLLLLHATSLEITLPGGERKIFNSDLPAIFKEFEKDG
jgi:23S rRNA pseudouridine1911/1915/1917 synthase